MAGKTRTENSYVGMKQEHRWQKAFPDKKCAKTQNPEMVQGAARNLAVDNKARLEQMGYRVIPLNDEELLALVDRTDFLLLGKPRADWEKDRADRAAAHKEARPIGDIEVSA